MKITESNGTLVDALPCPGRPGLFVTPEGVFRGVLFRESRAFVRRGVFLPGFECPGGWGGAGGSAWRDDGQVIATPSRVVAKPGNPATPALWISSPCRIGKGFEAAIRRLWEQAVADRRAELAREKEQAAAEKAAGFAAGKAARAAWERNLLSLAGLGMVLKGTRLGAVKIAGSGELSRPYQWGFRFGNFQLTNAGTPESAGFQEGWGK